MKNCWTLLLTAINFESDEMDYRLPLPHLRPIVGFSVYCDWIGSGNDYLAGGTVQEVII